MSVFDLKYHDARSVIPLHQISELMVFIPLTGTSSLLGIVKTQDLNNFCLKDTRKITFSSL